MKVMKFGGTSVGKPERMHQVGETITLEEEPKIVVLSALSGTTNALVSISEFLAAGDKDSAKKSIDDLEAHYHSFILHLLKDKTFQTKAKESIDEHFEFLNIILKIFLQRCFE